MRRGTIVLLLLALSGCGAHPRTGPCGDRVRAAFAATLDLALGATSAAAYVASSGAPACRLSARGVNASVSVDGAPQAYARLEREIVETEQVFTPHRIVAAPQTVSGLGLDAAWFPSGQKLMTTDGRRLITVTAPTRRLAAAIARAELTSR